MRTKYTFFVFSACSLALVGVIGWELQDGMLTTPSPQVSRSPAAGPASLPPESPNYTAYLDEILARPLFTPNRHPAPLDSAAHGTTKNAMLQSRLAGILVGPEEREALFVEAGKAKASLFHEGEELEGWTIEKIELEHVIMRAGVTSLTVEPAWAKRPVGGTALPFLPNSSPPQALTMPVGNLPGRQMPPAPPGADAQNSAGAPINGAQ